MESLKSPLVILVGVQTIILAALLVRMLEVEKRLDGAAPSSASISETPGIASDSPVAAGGLSVAEIRAIMRDELSSLKFALSNGAPPAPAGPPRTAQSDRAFFDVQKETQRLVAKGSVSEAELAALEMQIAELPAEQRRQALSAISKAVSNGTLDARF